MRFFLLSCCLCWSVLSTTALAQSATTVSAADSEAIGLALREFLYGASVNDRGAHEAFWADELTYTSSSGSRFGKATLLEGMANATRIDDAAVGAWYTAEDIALTAVGDAVVLNFKLVSTAVASAERETFYNSGVLIFRDDRWQAINWQATRTASTNH